MDERLIVHGDTMCQEKLCITLSSCEMIALARVRAIIHLSICILTRWLAGNSHELGEYDWSVRSMGKLLIDWMLSYNKLNMIEKITDEEFMMGFCDKIKSTLPPCQEYYKYIYEKKLLKLLAQNYRKVIPLLMLKNELFYMTSEVNQQIIQITASLGSIADTTLL